MSPLRARLLACLALAPLLALPGALAAAPLAPAVAPARPPLPAQAQRTLPAELGADSAGARYIVQLADLPLLTYEGSIPGYAATAPGADGGAGKGGKPRFDAESPEVLAYGDYLARQQAAFEARLLRIAPGARAQYHYRTALNGVTLRLTEEQAAAARALPGVLAVTREERIVPLMDTSPGQVGAPAAWADPRVGGRAEAGRGVRIAVIDSGITAAHPFFDDTGFTLPAEGGFPKASLTVGDQETAYGAEDLARFTNNKVIVARAYANPEVYDPAGPPTPLADGFGGFHGAHVAGIAAGSVTQGAPGAATGQLTLSGIAPGAQLMAYKFTDAYTPEIIRMIEDAVRDGADVINNSWGTSAMNVMAADRHPVVEAFRAASQAGVVIVAAAGNAGSNGEATLGGPHQMADEVITVANAQGGRSFEYSLYASDAELPENLSRHPAAYQSFGRQWDVIEGRVFKNDLCNPLSLAIGARGRVVLAPIEGTCPSSVLPIQLPDQLAWINKLINAALANAAGDIVGSVVFYAPDGEPATYGAVLQIVETIKPLLEGFLPSVKFPVTGVITGDEAMALADWADGHPTLTLRLDNTPATLVDPSLVDAANATTSQGPVPDGRLKPDLAAPGTEVLSAGTDSQGQPIGYTTASGTSMASPQVAGAVAVMRQAWPTWSPAEIKSALMVTADPVVTAGGALAPATVQGAGRLNLARALDPGLLALPPSFDFTPLGATRERIRLSLLDARLGAAESAVYRVSEEPGTGPEPGRKVLDLAPDAQLSIPAGGALDFEVPINAAALPQTPGAYDGRLVFTSEQHSIRVVYRLVVAGDKKDVLLLNVRRDAQAGAAPPIPGLPGGGQMVDTEDFSAYWTAALDEAGLSYDVWTVAADAEDGSPPLSLLQQYELVILAAGDGNAPLDQLAGGMTGLQMYLLGGGSLLASGHNYPHVLGTSGALGLQTNGAMYFLSRYFGGFERTQDDAAAPESLLPVRLFDRPIALASDASAEAAGNGDRLDLGRPLAALQTQAPPGGQALPPDLGLAAPMVVDRVMPYMRSYFRTAAGESAMTGVTADATLEQPVRADFIPWRALFAGFAVEAIEPGPGRLNRAELLARVHTWAVEPADLSLTIEGPAEIERGEDLELRVQARSGSGVEVESWRWDPGDGRPFFASPVPEVSIPYPRKGSYRVRVEALTRGGHTYVAEHALRVLGPETVYLPQTLRGGALR